MRHVLIVRHAKSSWDDASLSDHDRPLASRGIEALGPMRDHVATLPPPDLVLCSSARRTIDTLAGLRDALPENVAITVDGALYGAGASSWLARLGSVGDEVRTAMVVGHNPGLQELALGLAGSGDDDDLQQLWEKYPTGAIAALSFDGSWADLGPDRGRLDSLFLPRRPR